MNDTITYLAFKYAVASFDTQTYSLLNDDAFKPALVLAGTFLINTYIFMNYTGGDKFTYLIRPTTIVFIIGGLLSVVTYLMQ